MTEKTLAPPLDPILGIDLGTTNSLAAIVRAGRPEVLISREGKKLVPSVIHFRDGVPEIGYGAKSRKILESSRTVFSVKRLLGRAYSDVEAAAEQLPYHLVAGKNEVRVEIDGRTYSPVELSSMILRELKLSAESALGTSVRRAVITVPAYFNDSQRQATRMAGKLAGLEVLRIVNEPTAAALAFGLAERRNGLIAVYDLGGGTFDVSILKLHDGIFEVLSTAGDTRLGGDDLDLAVARWAAVQLKAALGLDPFTRDDWKAKLLEAAEQAKIRLATEATAQLDLDFGKAGRLGLDLSIKDFERLALEVLEPTRTSCELALQDAGIVASDLSEVLLVGGPTRLPVVQNLVEAIFGRKPNSSMNPDEVVAQGAAIQADILGGGNRDFLLLDVVPLSLGIETYGGLMSALIPRNTKVPAAAREIFTTYADRQTGVDIHVFQGERERVSENRSLARFRLTGLEPMPAGFARIEVLFLVDADGVLQVTARDIKSGIEHTVEVRPTYGMEAEEVERLLQDAESNSTADRAFRRWVEASAEAEPVLRACEKNLESARRLLGDVELSRFELALEELRRTLRGKSQDSKTVGEAEITALQSAHRELERASQSLAERMLGDLCRK